MKKIYFIIIIVFFSLRLSAGAALPGDFFFPEWKKSGSTRFFKKADLFNHIDGGAELFLEFGFKELQVQSYSGNEEKITLELYRMENATASLGIYLFKCGKETPLTEIPARNSTDPYQITAVKGDYFLQVNNPSGNRDLLPVMTALSTRVLAEIPTGEPVKLPDVLPSRDLLPGSRLIVRGPYGLQKIFFFGEGDILQLAGKTFAVAGDYKNASGGSYTMILIPFPNPRAAESAFRNLISNLDPYNKILSRKKKELHFLDYRKKFGTVQIDGPLMRIKINLTRTDAPEHGQKSQD